MFYWLDSFNVVFLVLWLIPATISDNLDKLEVEFWSGFTRIEKNKLNFDWINNKPIKKKDNKNDPPFFVVFIYLDNQT